MHAKFQRYTLRSFYCVLSVIHSITEKFCIYGLKVFIQKPVGVHDGNYGENFPKKYFTYIQPQINKPFSYIFFLFFVNISIINIINKKNIYEMAFYCLSSNLNQ